MSWQCFGWTGSYCHTGRRYFTSADDGMCVEDHDRDYDPQTYPYKFCFVAVNQPASGGVGRSMVGFFEGVEFYRLRVKDTWNWAEITTTLYNEFNRGRYRFELQNRYGTILCKRDIFLGEITEEVPVIDDPVVSEIDYDRIVEGTALIVRAARDNTISEINENEELIEGVEGTVKAVGESVDDKITESTSLIAEGLKAISGRISKIAIPNIADIKYAFMDVCLDLAVALWDTILERIEKRYPDDEEISD